MLFFGYPPCRSPVIGFSILEITRLRPHTRAHGGFRNMPPPLSTVSDQESDIILADESPDATDSDFGCDANDQASRVEGAHSGALPRIRGFDPTGLAKLANPDFYNDGLFLTASEPSSKL